MGYYQIMSFAFYHIQKRKKKNCRKFGYIYYENRDMEVIIRLLCFFTYCTILAVSNVVINLKFSSNLKNLQIKSALFCDITVK